MWTSVLKHAIVKYVLVACWLADCVAVCGCQSSDSAMDEFEKWQGPRIEQNIRMEHAPNYCVVGLYGIRL
jgi:hypothetical protein